MNQRYGQPKDTTLPYIQEFYCGMCNTVPIVNLIDPVTEERQGKGIADLSPIPMQVRNKDGIQTVELMVCWKCINRIEHKMREEVVRRFGRVDLFKRGPDDRGGDEGDPGGQTVR